MADKGEFAGARLTPGALANAGDSGVRNGGERRSNAKRRRCSHCGELKTPPELVTFKQLDCREVFEFCILCREEPEALAAVKEAFEPHIEKRREGNGAGPASKSKPKSTKNGSRKGSAKQQANGEKDGRYASSFPEMRGHREKAAKGSREAARKRKNGSG